MDPMSHRISVRLNQFPCVWSKPLHRHQREEEEEEGGLEELTAELTVREERKLRTPQATEEELLLWPHVSTEELSLKRELSVSPNNPSEELVAKLGPQRGDEVKVQESEDLPEKKEILKEKEVDSDQVDQAAPGDTTRWDPNSSFFSPREPIVPQIRQFSLCLWPNILSICQKRHRIR